MSQDNANSYIASFRNHSLRTWETDGGYQWEVTDSGTGEIIARGGPVSLEEAMIGAAGAAGADWGNARWRLMGESDAESA
jgi:hypothetical protein